MEPRDSGLMVQPGAGGASDGRGPNAVAVSSTGGIDQIHMSMPVKRREGMGILQEVA